jgi:hypothetical protein
VSSRAKGAARPPDDPATGPVLVRTVFERFPITIKGAFVLRGADANPHQARFERAVVARIPAGPDQDVPLDAVPLEVAPHRDLFLPFEAQIADLEPAWYVVRSEVRIDGSVLQEQDSKPFVVPWPRGAMRTGAVSAGSRVRLASGSIWIERLDLRTDRVEVVWRHEPAPTPPAVSEPSIAVLVDGQPLETLPPTAGGGPDAPGGRRRSVAYPVPKGAANLVVEVTGSDGHAALVPVALG